MKRLFPARNDRFEEDPHDRYRYVFICADSLSINVLKLIISRKMVIKIDSASGALGQDLRRSISAEIRFLDLMGVAKVPALPPPWQL